MTNREALKILQQEEMEAQEIMDWRGTISDFPIIEILMLMRKSENNPNFWNEEFKAEYPIQDEE